MTKTLTVILQLLGLFYSHFSFSQSSEKVTLNGYVKENGSGELLPGVNVYIKEKGVGTQTNKYGFYSITLNSSEIVTIIYSSVGFQTETRTLKIPKLLELNVNMTPIARELEEVIVKSNATEQQKVSENVQMSQLSIPIQQMRDVAAFLGEKDVLKVLQLMPGIQKGSEGNSGIYVRGGGPDQNLVILDDAPVYNAYHLFGFFSVFNGDALKSVQLTKGGFPARFGGRLSSVIEMQMKDGNKEKFHAEGGIGAVSSRLTLEGPLFKNHKASFLVSARRTYLDLLIRPITKTNDDDSGYYFYDLNAKLNYEFDNKNRIYLSGYFGKDQFHTENVKTFETSKSGLSWGNSTGTLRWNHLFSEKIFSNTSIIFSDYQFDISNDNINSNTTPSSEYHLKYSSGIRDWAIKFDLDFLPNPEHTIKAGLQLTHHRFTPSAILVKDTDSGKYKNETNPINAVESGLYLEDIYKPWKSLQINGGVRITQFSSNEVSHYNFEPRISTAFMLSNDLAVKASYAQMNQYIHLLSNSGTGLPTDLWVPSTSKIAPERSWQLAGGVAKDFSERNLSITLEAYYKRMNRIIALKEGSSFLLEDGLGNITKDKDQETPWDKNVTIGDGKSYGFEFLLQRKTGRFSGWIGYTLSWTSQQFEELNFGKEFWAKYDRRHDLSAVGIYNISPKITLSATWVYGTGNALTLPTSISPSSQFLQATDSENTINYTNNYRSRNNFRASPYHRMDASIQFHKKLKRGFERNWTISIYNLYNHYNPFYYEIKTRITNNPATGSPEKERYLSQISLFGILPSFGYSLKF